MTSSRLLNHVEAIVTSQLTITHISLNQTGKPSRVASSRPVTYVREIAGRLKTAHMGYKPVPL